MLQALETPPGLSFLRDPGSGPSYYEATTRTVVYVSPAPSSGELGAIAHEICHAAQHQQVLVHHGTHSGGLLWPWVETPAGEDFLTTTGWSWDGSSWEEDPELAENWGGYPNPLEDAAQVCAAWFDPGDFFGNHLQVAAPRRFGWVRRWHTRLRIWTATLTPGRPEEARLIHRVDPERQETHTWPATKRPPGVLSRGERTDP